MKISEKVRSIRPSATMEVTARAIALRAEGVDVVPLGAGEPDFDTPEHIKEAAIAALRGGATKYTPVGGTADLKEAIVAKMARDNGIEVTPDEVLASCGGKHSLYNIFQTAFDPGDEVIVPTPCWVSYPDMLQLAGAKPVLVAGLEENAFQLTPDQVREAITPKTRGIVLNSPSNPTGVAYTDEAMEALLRVVAEHSDVIVVSDDVYERILYDGRDVPKHPWHLVPEIRERIIVSNSVSKTYAMTGWRLGYTVAPAPFIKAMTKLQGQSTSNPTSIAQAGAAAALAGPQDCIPPMVAEFRERRDIIVGRLRALPGIEVVEPNGAFYVFPNVSSVFGRKWKDREIRNGTDFALYLLEEANVALVGGCGFESPSHVRISYATSRENIDKAMTRIEEAIASL